jgi:hypothetical protein
MLNSRRASSLISCRLWAGSLWSSRHSPGRGIVSKLMRNNALGNADRGCGVGQIWAQLFEQRRLAFVACQQPPIGREGVEGAEEA